MGFSVLREQIAPLLQGAVIEPQDFNARWQPMGADNGQQVRRAP